MCVQKNGNQRKERGDVELPELFEEMLSDCYAPDDVERIMAGSTGRRTVTLRANTLLSNRVEVASALDEAGITWSPVSWYDDAFVLEGVRERAVWDTSAYRSGKVYLQSLSSMIPALVLGAQPGEDICDMCAAPGGKTTQIAALTGGKACLTACETRASRADKLEHNLAKLGARNVTVMRTDARRLDGLFSFDRILVDAPCSGSGTLDLADPRCAKRFTSELIEKSIKSQRMLLRKALSLLRPGGSLVYSTCSVLARENDDVVAWALEHAPRNAKFELVPVEFARFHAMPLLPTTLEGPLALFPTPLYEGFYIAKMRRIR